MDLTELREEIIANIIESELSIDCVYYVMLDVMNEVTRTHNQYLQNKRQIQEIKKDEKNKEEKE